MEKDVKEGKTRILNGSRMCKLDQRKDTLNLSSLDGSSYTPFLQHLPRFTKEIAMDSLSFQN
jgi:hypothetical protein